MTGNKYFTQNRKNRDQNFVTSGEQSKGTAMGSPRDDWRKFKKLRNMVNNEIKRAKECHYKHALNEYQGDPRNTWRIVNELMSRKSHKSIINELKLPCGNSIYDSHELCNAFNGHFSSIGPKLANDIHANEENNYSSHLDYLAETGHCTFELKPTSVSKVLLLLSRLCKSKSTSCNSCANVLI